MAYGYTSLAGAIVIIDSIDRDGDGVVAASCEEDPRQKGDEALISQASIGRRGEESAASAAAAPQSISNIWGKPMGGAPAT